MAVTELLTVTYDGEPYLIVEAETPRRAIELAARHVGLGNGGTAALAPEQRLKLGTRPPTPAEVERWQRARTEPAGEALALSLLEDDN